MRFWRFHSRPSRHSAISEGRPRRTSSGHHSRDFRKSRYCGVYVRRVRISPLKTIGCVDISSSSPNSARYRFRNRLACCRGCTHIWLSGTVLRISIVCLHSFGLSVPSRIFTENEMHVRRCWLSRMLCHADYLCWRKGSSSSFFICGTKRTAHIQVDSLVSGRSYGICEN